jgi:hypothetical protein
LSCQSTLAKETTVAEYPDRRFLAGLGHDRESHPALLDVKNGVRRVPLGKDCLLLWHGQELPSVADRSEKGFRVELADFGRKLSGAHSVEIIVSADKVHSHISALVLGLTLLATIGKVGNESS